MQSAKTFRGVFVPAVPLVSWYWWKENGKVVVSPTPVIGVAMYVESGPGLDDYIVYEPIEATYDYIDDDNGASNRICTMPRDDSYWTRERVMAEALQLAAKED